MRHDARFGLVYALLAASLVVAGLVGYAAWDSHLGWMPYLGARANETLAEVAVLDPLGRASFWVAQYGRPPDGSGVEVRRWTTCPASNIYC